jgi:hypothetical protein
MATALVPLTAQASGNSVSSLSQKLASLVSVIPQVSVQNIPVSSVNLMTAKVKEITAKNKTPLQYVGCKKINNTQTFCIVLEFHKKNSDKQNNEAEKIASTILSSINPTVSISKNLYQQIQKIQNTKKVTVIDIQVKPNAKAKK